MFPRQYAYFLLTNPLKAIKDHEENTALTLWSQLDCFKFKKHREISLKP